MNDTETTAPPAEPSANGHSPAAAVHAEEPGSRECSWCQRAPGLLLLGLAGALAYIGLDLWMGGGLSRRLAGVREDDGDQEVTTGEPDSA